MKISLPLLKLQTKIFLSITFIMSLFVIGQFIVEYERTKTKAKDYFLSTNQTINKILKENIRGYIFENDTNAIKALVDAVESKYISNIYILNPSGEILYSKIDTQAKKFEVFDRQPNDEFILSGFELLDVNMGYMLLQSNTALYEEELRAQVIALVLTVLLVYCFGLFLAWFIARQISAPIDAIIMQIKETKTDEPITFETQNIAELQYLTTVLQYDRNALIELNHTLEDKIQDEIAKNLMIEKKLFESEKLASMGEMIGNIAHQWRQPLSIISTIASGIKMRDMYGQMQGYKFHDDMDAIVFQTQYLSKTIDDFRNFIKDTSVASKFGIKTVIEKTLSIVGPGIKNHHIHIVSENIENFTINGYENELIQCLVNLINNSKDALNENILDDDKKYIFIETHFIDNKSVLRVYDSGGGIKESIMHKIFEPYFTTKHQSIGTGIGLSMVYKILSEHHDASIEVCNYEFVYKSLTLRGARFDIIFPTV